MTGAAVLSSVACGNAKAKAVVPELTAGAKLQAFTLPDQHDENKEVTAGTRLVVFTRDKDVGKMVFGVLGPKDNSYLAQRDAAFIMDISAMPRIITWAVAGRKMRRHNFRFMLDAPGETTRAFPARPGQATLLHLSDLAVEKISFVSNAGELKRELDSLPLRQ